MRILIVHNILWAHYKSSVFQALQKLADQKNVSLKVLQIARNERSRAGLEVATGADSHTYSYNHELLFDRFLEDVAFPERVIALLRRSKAFQPDVVMLTGYYDLAQIILLLWAKVNGVRVVLQSESTIADQQRSGWKELLKKWLFTQCDGFFCFGSQSANYLINLGVVPETILLRKNAVDNTTLQLAYEKALPTRDRQQQALGLQPNNFVFVGRFIPFKNIPTFLIAFAEACRRSPQSVSWGIILLGDGPDQDILNQQIIRLGLSNVVKFLPGRPWFQVPEVLALSDVLVLPSYSEPWGLVVNEAMACGLPVIVSDRCGCVPDLVHNGQNGFVFDSNQPDELTAHLLKFINNEVNREQMSQSSRHFIAPYAPEVVAQEMLDGFEHLLHSVK